MNIQLIVSIFALIASIVMLVLAKETWLTVISVVLLGVSVLNLSRLAYKEYQRRITSEYILKTKFSDLSSTGLGTGFQQGVGMPPSIVQQKQMIREDRQLSDDFALLQIELEQNAIDDAKLVAETEKLLKTMNK